MIEFKRDTVLGRWEGDLGSWRGLKVGLHHRSASVTCPNCGRTATLTDHDIAADGTVTPSLVCPHGGCGFHDHVKLVGWMP